MNKSHYKVVLDVFVTSDTDASPRHVIERTIQSAIDPIVAGFGADEPIRVEKVAIEKIELTDSRVS